MNARGFAGCAALALVGATWVTAVAMVAPRLVPAPSRADAVMDAATHQKERRAEETRMRFEQAVVMLHAKEYQHAATALHRVLELAPELPEAHVNMGYALLGMQRADAARDFFESALTLRTTQANAYFGLAMAQEARGDLLSALGAMRSFLHTAAADDPFRARARSALWEWERALGRGSARGPDAAARH